MEQAIKTNLKTKSHWIRGAFLVGFVAVFYLIYQVALWGIAILTLSQFMFVLFSGKTNQQLRNFGSKSGEYLGKYITQMVKFLTYASDEKPFPFTALSDSAQVSLVQKKTVPPVPTPIKKVNKK